MKEQTLFFDVFWSKCIGGGSRIWQTSLKSEAVPISLWCFSSRLSPGWRAEHRDATAAGCGRDWLLQWGHGHEMVVFHGISCEKPEKHGMLRRTWSLMVWQPQRRVWCRCWAFWWRPCAKRTFPRCSRRRRTSSCVEPKRDLFQVFFHWSFMWSFFPNSVG